MPFPTPSSRCLDHLCGPAFSSVPGEAAYLLRVQGPMPAGFSGSWIHNYPPLWQCLWKILLFWQLFWEHGNTPYSPTNARVGSSRVLHPPSSAVATLPLIPSSAGRCHSPPPSPLFSSHLPSRALFCLCHCFEVSLANAIGSWYFASWYFSESTLLLFL